VISFFNNLTTNINISSYFTPFRWFFILRPFDSNSFGILFGALFVVAVVFVVALTLSLRRDVGEGIAKSEIRKAL
jgi:putative exporter of polyketide antibiotics